MKEDNVTCSNCIGMFYKKPSKINENLNFCSNNCMKVYRENNNFRKQKRKCCKCEQEYFPTYEPQVYCSRSCSMDVRGEEKTKNGTYQTKCSWCEKSFSKRNSQKGKTGDFCSVECGEAFKRGNQEKIVTKQCRRCKNNFESLFRLHHEYCSRKCSSLYQPGEEHFGFGKEGPTKGIKPWTFGKTAKTDERIFLLGKKVSIILKQQFESGQRNHFGKNNPNFGITVLQRTPQQLENYSTGAWKRYNSVFGSGFGFFKGHYTSLKTNIKMRHRSSYEKKIMMSLDLDPEVKTYKYEPFALKYTETNRYYPDFLIEYVNGSKILLEAKGWVENEEKFKLKNEAAQKYCDENNIKFEIWKKDEVQSYYKQFYNKNIGLKNE